MDNSWYNSKQGMNSQEKRQREREEAYEESLIEDLAGDFRLPINHRPTENLDTDNLEQASFESKDLAPHGVGKQEQDDYFTAEENIQRRKLEVEVEETEELAKKREVVAEREQKIQSEVKEIRKVFFCELCNKQYKLAMEFEAHLSSYDHNHKKEYQDVFAKDFKEMKEMHAGSSRDDRQKREQLRQEKEMAKFVQIADAQRLQQQQQQQEGSGTIPASSTVRAATSLAVQDQRKALKFGFAAKAVPSKTTSGIAMKKTKVVAKVSSVFGDDSEEEP